MTILFLILTYVILRQTPARDFADRHILKALRKIERMMESRLEKRGEQKSKSIMSWYYTFWIARTEQAIRLTHPHLPSKEATKKIVAELDAVEEY